VLIVAFAAIASEGHPALYDVRYALDVGLLISVAGLVSGGAGYFLARRDVSLMRAGLMDAAGQQETQEAACWSAVGMVAGLVCTLLLGVANLLLVCRPAKVVERFETVSMSDLAEYEEVTETRARGPDCENLHPWGR
jgi:hypothetical protein